MAKLTPLSLSEARQVLAGYDFEPTRIEAIDGGSVNSSFRLETGAGVTLFVRVYEEQDASGAERELELVTELARFGVPTPAPIARRDGGLLCEHAAKPVAVFPWVAGASLCQARVTPAHCRAVGEALARLHLVPVRFEHAGRFRVEDLVGRLDAIETELAGARGREPAATQLVADVAQIRRALAAHAARRNPDLPRGVIHGDLFRDNVLWNGPQIAALIDFESVSFGPLAYDVMVTLEAWCFSDAFDTELATALLAGYDATRALTDAELAALPTEGALAALRFATTRITDYSLRAPPNEPPLRDYQRFLRRLDALQRGAPDCAALVAKLRSGG